MIAIVLVGGEGTRMRPLTIDTPKPMLPILGRPMIGRIVEWLARHGVDQVVFSLAYRADAFVDAFPSGTWAGVRLEYQVEPTPLDTAGAIRFAALAAGVEAEELVICNGDVLTDLDLAALVDFHRRAGARATIAVAPVEDTSVFGVVVADGDGRIEAFIEKPPAGTAPSNLVNIGTYVFAPGLVDEIAGGRRVSVEREVFPSLVSEGSLFAYVSEPYWLDTGTPDRFVCAQLDILRGTNHGVELDGTPTGVVGQFIGDGATVLGEIEGLAYLGPDAVVAHGAQVTDSILGPGAQVACGAVVVSSVLLAGALIGEDALVIASIVGAGARLGVGAAVLDESVIGNDQAVAPGVRLERTRLPQ